MCLDSVRASVPVLERNMWLHAAADGRVLVHGVLADRRHGADSCLPGATLWHPHHSASLRKLPQGACIKAGVPPMKRLRTTCTCICKNRKFRKKVR